MFIKCECQNERNGETYVSVANKVSCSGCFTPLKKVTEDKAEASEVRAKIVESEHGWSVKVGDECKGFFSVQEDCALTEARKLKDKINSTHKPLGIIADVFLKA